MVLLRVVLPAACFALALSAGIPSLGTGTNVYHPGRPESTIEAAISDDKLVYADFEKVVDNRPVSSRGGYIKLYTNEQNPSKLCRVTGAAGSSDVPELVRLSKDSPNRALAFDYQLRGPNQYAEVGVEVHGLPDKDGKPVPDDVTGYKHLSLQLYVTGVRGITVEFHSHGLGVTYQNGVGPQMTFVVGAGMSTYHVQLNKVQQPGWVENKIDAKEVLAKLTQINVRVGCAPCDQLINGTVVVDNLVLEK